MNCLEALNSEDIEIAELYATLLWNEIGLDALKESLKNNKLYDYGYNYKEKVYLKRKVLSYQQNSIWLQDPTKSILIQLE